MLAADAMHPDLGLRRAVLDADGGQLLDEAGEPVWTSVGSPDNIRHSIHTQ